MGMKTLEVTKAYDDVKVGRRLHIGEQIDVDEERAQELLSNPNNIVKLVDQGEGPATESKVDLDPPLKSPEAVAAETATPAEPAPTSEEVLPGQMPLIPEDRSEPAAEVVETPTTTASEPVVDQDAVETPVTSVPESTSTEEVLPAQENTDGTRNSAETTEIGQKSESDQPVGEPEAPTSPVTADGNSESAGNPGESVEVANSGTETHTEEKTVDGQSEKKTPVRRYKNASQAE